MKIVFFGSPKSALPALNKILDAGNYINLIITQPDRPSGRGKKLAISPVKKFGLDRDIPIYQPEKIRKDPIIVEKIKASSPDLNIVVAYGQIIPSSVIYLPKYDSINMHFSLLPKYKGASPVHWAILNGDKKTGITIFKLNEKMDEGDILSQEEVEIFSYESSVDLEARLALIGADLLLKTISRIDKIKPRKQDHSLSTYAPLLKKEDGKINWEKDSAYIERQVKAFNPWPSTYTFLEEKRIKILQGKSTDKKGSLGSPGEILKINKEGLEICCGDRNSFLIEILQPENKKEMNAYSFSLGGKIKPGDKFSVS